jgi:hypothetical protein
MLSTHEFLTPEECSRTREIIFGLKDKWVNRASGFMPFYTLGAASYLDSSPDDAAPYYQATKRYNPILASNFPLLYDRLSERLTEITGIPTKYADNMALPGFHIFLYSKTFEYPIAHTHFDLQFQTLKWEYEKVDLDHPISFTCPIVMPKTGSGLNWWEITREDTKDLSEEGVDDLKRSKETLYFPYKLGNIILHEGLVLHQIAPSKDLEENDERITLQGHGLVCDGVLRLYW